MPCIRVDPDHLRELAHRFSETAGALQVLHDRLSGAWGQLGVGGWEGKHRSQVEPQWWQARTRLNALTDQAAALSRFLDDRAVRFEEADRAGAVSVGQVASAFAVAQQTWNRWFRPLQSVLSFPQDLAGRLLRLGGWVARAPVAFAASVGGLFAGFFAGTRFLRPVSPQWRQQLDQAAGHVCPLPSPSVAVPPPTLRPADPAKFSSCALYAQARRPDLGRAGGDGGAYNYIGNYRGTEQYYRITADTAEGDLRQTQLRPGTAVVWDRGVRGADATYGHVAIIEEVGPDYIEVSEAGWGSSTRRHIPASHLPDLHFIL